LLFWLCPEVYSMGFDEAHVRYALAQANSDEHIAIDLLISGQLPLAPLHCSPPHAAAVVIDGTGAGGSGGGGGRAAGGGAGVRGKGEGGGDVRGERGGQQVTDVDEKHVAVGATGG